MIANDNTVKVIELGPNDNMSVEEVIEFVRRHPPKELLLCGYDENNVFVSLSSRMKKSDALWLIEELKAHIFGYKLL